MNDLEAATQDGSPPPRISYRIDGHDNIHMVSASWAPFAMANGAPQLATGAVGRSLWMFVTDLTTEQLYRDLVGRVRAGHTITFPYRCDAPDTRRFMRMAMMPCELDGVAFDSVTVRTEPREPPLLLASTLPRTKELLRVCSWCKRVDVEGEWEEVERAVEHLRLFTTDRMPAITHAICPPCIARMTGETEVA